MNEKFSWLTGGIMLGAVFLVAVWLIKPVGVSTQFVIVDGIVWNILSPELITESDGVNQSYSSTNAYLNKGGGKYASNVINPLNYGFIFVLSMVLGAVLSGILSKNKISKNDKFSPKVWRDKFGRHISSALF